MNVLFCHDGPINESSDGVYYHVAFNNALFNRYKVLADSITIAMRIKHTEESNISSNMILSNNFKVIECPNLSSITGIFNSKKCYNILTNAVKASDFVIARLPSIIGNMAIEAAKKNNKPCLIELVGCAFDALWNHSLTGKIVAPYFFYKTRKNVYNGKYVLYVTDKFLQKRYPNNNFNIGCSDVCLPFNNGKKEIKKINKKNLVIGTLGNVNIRYKGQEYVIKAIKLLKRYGINVNYQLVGDGNQERLKHIAKKYGVLDNIVFLGSIPHNQVFNWLTSLDIYIQPSMTEGMPRALIEAMSVGCVCMGSNVGGIPELLDENAVFSKGNSLSIAKKILNLDNTEFMRQSKLNLIKSLEFEPNKLADKRNKFYMDFKNMELENENNK